MPNKVRADALEIPGSFDISLEAENSSRAKERKVGRARSKFSNIEHGSVHNSARNFREIVHEIVECDTMESVANDELGSPKTTRSGRVRRTVHVGAGIASGRFKSGDRIGTIGGRSTSTGVKAAANDGNSKKGDEKFSGSARSDGSCGIVRLAVSPIDIEDEKSGEDCDMTAFLAIASKVSENNLYAENRKEFQNGMVMYGHLNLDIGVSECISQASVGLTGSAEILAGAGANSEYLHGKVLY